MNIIDKTIRAFLSKRENVSPLLRLGIKSLEEVKDEEVFTDDGSLTRFFLGKDSRYKAYARESDCVVLVKSKEINCIVIIEVQSFYHLAMPLRALEYVSGAISRQRKLLERKLRDQIRKHEVKPTQEELLSGMLKSDSLLPVFYLTLNISDEEWKEESTHARLSKDIRKDKASMPYWTPCILDLAHYSEKRIRAACNGNDCVHLYLLLKHRHEREWIKSYLHSIIELEGLTMMAICVCLGLKDIPQIGYKEKISMCTVGRRIEEDYRAEGLSQGLKQGRTESLLSNLKSLIRKLAITPEAAMDMLDVPAEERPALLAGL